MYEWICEKCGEENRSSSNVCRNAPCGFVFHQTKDQVVRCGRCRTEQVGSSLYRTGRNTTFPMRRLSPSELHHPDYDVYGEPGRRYLDSLWPFVGQYLCPGCHPSSISLKIDASVKNPSEVLDPNVSKEVLESKRAYERMADRIRKALSKIKAANSEMTAEEEVKLARRLIRKLDNDEFLSDNLDLELRRIIRAAIVSRVSLRKNIEKKRLGEYLYRFWRIEEAVSRKDQSYLRKVLKEERRRAERVGEAIVSDARKGPDLFSMISSIESRMEALLEEVSVLRGRVEGEKKVGEVLKERMSVLYDRLEKLRNAFSGSNDPVYLSKLGPILHRVQTLYSQVTQKAEGYLTPMEVAVEEEKIAALERRLFTRYAPLLSAARRIIFWDIKEDLWKNSDGSEGAYYDPPKKTEYVEVGRRKDGSRNWQKVTVSGYEVPNELASVRCEICDKFTQTPQLLRKVHIARRINPFTGQADRVEISDIVPRDKLTGILPEEEKLLHRASLLVCYECKKSSSASDVLKAVSDRRLRKMQEWDRLREEAVLKKAREELGRKAAVKSFRDRLFGILRSAMNEVTRIGVIHAAPVFEFDSAKGIFKMIVVAVPSVGVTLPEKFTRDGWSVEIKRSRSPFFTANYLWNYLSENELSFWRSGAKKAGYTMVPFGLLSASGTGVWDARTMALIVGRELPLLPPGFWKGVAVIDGIVELHPNLRDAVKDADLFDMEPMYPYGKPTEAEVLRKKAVAEEVRRRRNEEAKFWDPLRKRRKGGAKPKPAGKKIVKTPGVPPGTPETPMDLSKGVFDYDADPSKKDLSKFMMVAPPARPDECKRPERMLSKEDEKAFFRKKGEGSAKDIADAKAVQERSKEIFKKYDPVTFQRVRLPRKD